MKIKLNNICRTEIKRCQKRKRVTLPQGWAYSDRACKHNKTVTDSNSKHVFGCLCCTHTAEHPSNQIFGEDISLAFF